MHATDLQAIPKFYLVSSITQKKNQKNNDFLWLLLEINYMRLTPENLRHR